ncbi:protein starmaker-like isoform X2 [Sipha flava]|uniref:Protein starmaker-like isoform X2 n=1 Tax=Sipha flava TaxID=143950 RepID=A0A8B8FNI5_9HEMI|nr:protein starmaker-like isoform X2 [Sipha flava]
MFVDVLKRYLLIVWNFFFGQGSTDSIQDSTKDQPVESADTVPYTEADNNVLNEKDNDDDIEESFDDEEDEDEEEGEDEEDVDDEDVKEVVPKKPDVKIITNDVPSKPNAPSLKIPEPLKVDDIKIKDKENPKDDVYETKTKESSDVVVKKEEMPVSKPEFEIVEKEDPKAASTANDVAKSAKLEFEIIERETPVKKPAKDANQEFEIVEKEALKVVPGKKEDVVKTTEKEAAPKTVVSGKDDVAATANHPKDDVKKTAHVKFEDEVKGGSAEQLKEVVAAAAHPNKIDDFKLPAVIKDQPADKVQHQGPATETISKFVGLEKGEGNENDGDLSKIAGCVDTTIDSFLLGEQRHSNGTHHPETSIQDQQLEYSDSGEELSDDDIEIDYEDDEDDEEVEEVKPLPPVARSVYKKND